MYHYPLTFTFAANTKVSVESQPVGTLVPVGIFMSAGWDAASLCFDVSLDGVAWQPLYGQNGTEVSVPVVAGESFVINPADYAGFPYLRLRSGSGAGVNQTAQRVINMVFRNA